MQYQSALRRDCSSLVYRMDVNTTITGCTLDLRRPSRKRTVINAPKFVEAAEQATTVPHKKTLHWSIRSGKACYQKHLLASQELSHRQLLKEEVLGELAGKDTQVENSPEPTVLRRLAALQGKLQMSTPLLPM